MHAAEPIATTNARLMPRELPEILALAVALGARTVPGWSAQEDQLVHLLPGTLPFSASGLRQAIREGNDPLGDAFCRMFTGEERRPRGATYTPQPIVQAMVEWAASRVTPVRIVDPGAGSARFLASAGRRFPQAELIASELDPIAAVLARGHLAAAGLADRSHVIVGDYRRLDLPKVDGPTLYLGNPPYVRHHLIEPDWKTWLAQTAKRHGLKASQLAGLHVHFFLATAEHAERDDVGVLITAAEWMDVNYGRLVRKLLMGRLGAMEIHVIEPTADPFPGTRSTAVITGFKVGANPERVGLQRITSPSELHSPHTDCFVRRERLEVADRWTPLTRPPRERREGFVELGELCRVHRGQATGANYVWVVVENEFDLPEEWVFPSVTRARELIASNGILTNLSGLRRVVDLPANLDVLDAHAKTRVDRFLDYARAQGAHRRHRARARLAWWNIGLREAAPILATYMARRSPVFVRNIAGARHLNIAHGLYPRETICEDRLTRLVEYLSLNTDLADGRTYAGGLTKYEPREMERLLVPHPQLLMAQDWKLGW